ncbi:MAG: DUF692 domain-containing protein [Fibrobacteria bacterium]|nr:DUF692 domain-containing protein [Fibrobacteria bacterium]
MTQKWKIGVGLRVPHYGEIFSEWPDVDFFEIISENYLSLSGTPKKNLDKALSKYPLVMHGVSMNLGSTDELDTRYLDKIKKLASYTGAPYLTDHLCWTGVDGVNYHDLLPMPYTRKNAVHFAEKIKQVQDYINIPFGIENLSSYATFSSSEMTEWEFFNLVVELSGCSYMLDINNVYVSSVNAGFSPEEYLKSIKWEKVLQCHIAGHSKQDDGSLIDTHDNPVCDEVWQLYQKAWEMSGGFHTLLEWDANFMSFKDTHAEAQKARLYQPEVQHSFVPDSFKSREVLI